MLKLCFDYGHGGKDPGAVYGKRKEKDDALKIGRLVADYLRRYGVLVDESRLGDKTLSLKARSDFEKKKSYDFFISFHRNAYKAEAAKGAETYIYLNGNKKAKELALEIQKGLKNVGFRDRGVKKANFHVLRETRSPAILIELGFIDNSIDNKLFIEKEAEIVLSISNAILKVLSISVKKDEKKEKIKTYYGVMAGSFRVKNNAKKRVESLRKAGFESIIIPFKDD